MVADRTISNVIRFPSRDKSWGFEEAFGSPEALWPGAPLTARLLEFLLQNPQLADLTAKVDKLASIVQKHEDLLKEVIPVAPNEDDTLASWLVSNGELAEKYGGKHIAVRRNGADFAVVAEAKSINELYSLVREMRILSEVEFAMIPIPMM